MDAVPMSMIDVQDPQLSACAILNEAYLQIYQNCTADRLQALIKTRPILDHTYHHRKYDLVSNRYEFRVAKLGTTLIGLGEMRLLHDSTDKSRKIRGALRARS